MGDFSSPAMHTAVLHGVCGDQGLCTWLKDALCCSVVL